MYVGEGDQVGFVVVRRECIEGVTDLFDLYRAAKGGFLRVVALELDAMLVIPDTVGCRRRVVASTSSAWAIAGFVFNRNDLPNLF